MAEDRRDADQPDRRFSSRARVNTGRRDTDPPAEWLSVTAYARVHGVSRRTVQKWLRAAILKTYRVGTLIRIRNIPPDEHQSTCAK